MLPFTFVPATACRSGLQWSQLIFPSQTWYLLYTCKHIVHLQYCLVWVWYIVFFLHVCSPTIISFPLSTFCTVCKFMCTFGDTAFIYSLNVSICGKQDTVWLPSYLPGEHLNGRFKKFGIGNLLVQSVVNRILCLVPLDLMYKATVPYGQDQWDLTDSTLLQGYMQQL